MSRLVLPSQGRLAILAHADFGAPDESCGLLAGSLEGVVAFVYPLTNSNPSPTTYTIEPYEHYRAWKHASGRGWELIGAFHSHPQGPPHPSPTDVRLAAEPDWAYLIASGREIRAFRVGGGHFHEIPLSAQKAGLTTNPQGLDSGASRTS
jgi:proteasome lid subunit RPN8/RPN11